MTPLAFDPRSLEEIWQSLSETPDAGWPSPIRGDRDSLGWDEVLDRLGCRGT